MKIDSTRINTSQSKTERQDEKLIKTVFDIDFGYNKFLSAFLPSHLIQKPLVVVLDDVQTWKTHPGLENFIVTLATDSSRSGKSKTIVCVSDFELAQTILDWNGNQKISCKQIPSFTV